MRIFRSRHKDPKPTVKEILRAVKDYLDEGLSVIPGNPETKQPVGKWKEYQQRQMTLQEAEEKFDSLGIRMNVIVVCGFPKIIDGKTWYLFVIDFDDKKLYEKWPETLKDTRTSETGKGIHCWYYVSVPPPNRKLKELGVLLDLQGVGAYIVAPPSWHEGKQKRYQWKPGKPDEIMKLDKDMERFVFDWIEENKLVQKSSMNAWKKLQKVHDIDKLLAGVEKGERDFAAIRVASWYCQAGLIREEALTKLYRWDLKNKPPMQTDSDEPVNVLEIKVNSAYDNEYGYRFTRDMTPLDKEGVQELTPELKAFLERPDLHDAIIIILDTVIIGETSLKALHFYVGIGTAFLKTPFGIIIIDIFGSGKSYTQRNMASIFPASRVEQPTSLTMKVVNYLSENFKGRILRIDELFGEEEGMPYIRIWMTEARLEHWVTDRDTWKEKKIISEGCPVFFTSTTKPVEDQYGSRNWITCIDTSKEQTLEIHNFDFKHDALPENVFIEETDQRAFLTKLITWIMQNAKPVLIPLHFTFPLLPRARRDRQQFKQLIMCVANVFQLQRKKKTFGGKEYVVAQKEDFDLALKIASPFIFQTMKTLDKYAMAIVKWAQGRNVDENFSIGDFWKEYQEKEAVSYGTIWERFKKLRNAGYIEPIDDIVSGRKTYYQLTDMGRQKISVVIELVDDGQWLLDAYDHLDDPKVKLSTFQRFEEILREDKEKFLQPSRLRKARKVGKEKDDNRIIRKMMERRKKNDSDS